MANPIPRLMAFVALVAFGALAHGQDVPERGVLFECRQPGVAPSHLMGTMHSSDPRVLTLADTAAAPLARARLLVLEVVPDAAAMAETLTASFLPAGESLEKILEPALMTEVLAVAERRGLPRSAVVRMKPWALATSLSLPAGETGLFLDLRLYHLAQEAGQTVVGVETAAEQLALFESLSMDSQIALLAHAVRFQDTLPTHFEAMVQAYLDGDLPALQRLGEDEQAELAPQLQAWFRERLIDARNALMLERLRPTFAEGGAFVAVGALHLPGPNGLLAGLHEIGCAWKLLR
jgi:uncharacterized protein YbaP (TraB family)